MLSFKDFIVVDYTPGMPDQISYNAMKRKRGRIGESSDIEQKYEKTFANSASQIKSQSKKVKETLDFSQRRARGRMMKRIKAKLKIGREKAKRKTASMDVLKKRATKQVRMMLFKKFSKGKSRGDLSPAIRQGIEKRINKLPQSRIMGLVTKELPKTRKKEIQRKSNKGSSGPK